MWANAKRDGRPAKYRWRPLLEYRAVTLPRRETRINLLGCPNTRQRFSAVTGPKLSIGLLWRNVEEVLLFNMFFFRLSIHAFVAKIWPDKVARWYRDGDFLHAVFAASRIKGTELPPANILIPLERQLIALQLRADSFYIMKLCSRLFVLHCRNCPKDDKFRYFIPILRKLAAA